MKPTPLNPTHWRIDMDEMELLAQARKLRDLGYAVIVFCPEELEGLDPRDVEDELVTTFSYLPKPEAP